MNGSAAKQHLRQVRNPQDGLRGNRVRARILVPFSFVLLFVITAFLVTAYFYENRNHEAELLRSVEAAERLFRQRLENDAAAMHAALIAIARDADLKKAFRERNREKVLKLAWPLFDGLRQNNGISHYYFTGPDRVNFLRVHKPDQYGDLIDRITILRTAQAREVARGIELGPLGTFTLRVVLPWYDGGEFIGFLELGKEINRIVEEVHEILGMDILVLVYERFLHPRRWEARTAAPDDQDTLSRFGSEFVVGWAMERTPESLIKVLEREDRVHEDVLELTEGGRNLYVGFLPLLDVGGREVGDFIVVRDVTDLKSAFRQSVALSATLSILVGGGVFVILYAILGRVERDYRRQREMELQLTRANAEQQKVIQVEKLSAMGLMIGEIAHQLNNPLVGVVNMAQLAERDVDDPARVREFLGEIQRAGKDCHAFVQRMLDFTKLSSFDRRPTEMNILVEETINLLKQSTDDQNQVISDLPKRSPVLNVDPVLIRHAVFNLLSNAVQASPPGGKIAVRLYPEVNSQDGTPGWCIAVQDEGPGLSEVVQSKIFTPFFTTREEGTGLGLPVVQHVAILHEGRITAGNAEDGGALFEMWLPTTEGA